MRKFILLMANGFGLGLSPVASGTAGALLGVVIVLTMGNMEWMWQTAIAALLSVLAIPICDFAEKIYGRKDDHRIVADEYMTYPLCMIGLPWMSHPWLLAVGFVVNRALDVIKPPPARQIQAMHGGAGIVLDDVISSLYALAINHLVFRLIVK